MVARGLQGDELAIVILRNSIIVVPAQNSMLDKGVSGLHLLIAAIRLVRDLVREDE